MSNAQVDIVVEEGGAFRYTIYGAVQTPGSFQLRTPDLSLLEALAQAGGVPDQVEDIYVIRRIPLTEETRTPYERGSENGRSEPATPENGTPAVDIEDLIDQLDDEDGGVSPGVLRQDGEPAIDIDELAPPRAGDEPEVDIEAIPGRTAAGGGGSWVYVEERNEWVRVPSGRRGAGATALVPGDPPLYAERVIKVRWSKLSRGDSRSNIVVRPDDLIYIQAPVTGLVYVDGQVVRPGPFSIPPDGVTLVRMIATAGGLNQLAIPERVDLVRKIGPNREAVIRINLAAIQNKTEPDIYLKPDDYINVGTSFWAAPLAVIRNGFRATYGFGFLLDRNFGNDVFGAPPTNRQGL